MKSGVVFLIAGAALAVVVLLAGAGKGQGTGRGVQSNVRFDAAEVSKLLDDRNQPWFKAHTVPSPRFVEMSYVPIERMGSFANPPAKFPVMPLIVAWHLTYGPKTLPKGHPFEGRPVKLFDIRLKSLRMMETIPGSDHLVWNALNPALKEGELKGLDRRTVMILYGNVYPHYDAAVSFRGAGFDAVYVLEGGLDLWKSKGLPIETDAQAIAMINQLNAERPDGVPAPQHITDPENIAPIALKTAMELGLKPLIVFVGDKATFDGGHIPGAIRVAFEDLKNYFETKDREQPVVLYCGCCTGLSKGLSGMGLALLKTMGYKHLFHLQGHLAGWKEHGLPLDIGVKTTPEGPPGEHK